MLCRVLTNSFVILSILSLTGCLVVNSDAAKLDPDSGALTIDFTSDSPAASAPVVEEVVDPKKIKAQEEKVEELEMKVADLEIDFHIAEMERDLSRESTEHRHQELERAVMEAEHEMRMFHEFDRPTREFESRRSVIFAETRLKDSRTELEQLELLYAGAELEDGTAELVLQRGRMSLARAEESLGQTRREHQVEMEVRIPRAEERLQRAIESANRDQSRAETEAEIARIQEDRKEEKMQRELEEQLEALEKARHELRNMTGLDDREQSVAWGLF
ncbi:MAG TPA: hypothetical protein DGU45_03435 [Planctomycetes bacterium]|nr:hypothetical protein [Planctomycetota bacterium]